MKDNKISKKFIVIAIIAISVLIVVGGGIFLKVNKNKKGYRIVKVYKTQGEVLVNQPSNGEIGAYENMLLESGDKVVVGDGFLTLKLDDDKYLYAYENTEFELVLNGDAANSKTSINLIEGMITNDIQNKLSDESYYEVNTPNSTMSVRGTGFTANTYINQENNLRYTDVAVNEGSVELLPINVDGTKNEAPVLLAKEEFARIYTNDENESKFVEEEKNILGKENYMDEAHGAGDDEVKDFMKVMYDMKAGSTVDDSIDLKNKTFKVSFMYNGSVFATQNVKYEGYASKPALNPAAGGDWDYDFNKTINKDTVIEWK